MNNLDKQTTRNRLDELYKYITQLAYSINECELLMLKERACNSTYVKSLLEWLKSLLEWLRIAYRGLCRID